ncbi:hypothetical protein ACIRBX_27600 [Kitasatospora sp. NPDC096147]|uniref:hypothetical protein n=1 Tax=Kitasatospora sp. NPDC096147 TaxID=3364093 RepID=UPI0037F1D87F
MIRKAATAVTAATLAALAFAPTAAEAAGPHGGEALQTALDTSCEEVGKLGTQQGLAMAGFLAQDLPGGRALANCTAHAISEGDGQLASLLNATPIRSVDLR